MLEVRLHGRGGQGVVTSAELLSVAAFVDGRHAQAFPSFGSERTGAPVVAFCRIGNHPIRAHEPIAFPQVVIIQDPTLLHQVDVFGGLMADGHVLINSTRSLGELGLVGLAEQFHVTTVAASELGRRHLGRPLPGTALLGAFAALTGAVSLDALLSAIRSRFPGPVGEGNAAAAAEAHAALEAVHA